MLADGELGDVRLVTGHYHQDWLAKDTDWNWRLTAEAGGSLRSVGDIGTHWADLTSFVTGMRPSEVLAELATFIPERREPTGPVETFQAASGETRARTIDTDDAALVMLRYPNGARGAVTISQVSPGRKNNVSYEIAGSRGTALWDSETPDHLWLGSRDAPNAILQRDAALMNATGAAAAQVPGGHVEGFADTFSALFNQVYADRRGRGTATIVHLCGFRGRPLGDGVLRSGAGERQVRRVDDDRRRRGMKLGLLTAPFEDRTLEAVADWAASERYAALEVACWPAASGDRRRYAGTSHIDVDGMTAARGSEIVGMLASKGVEISGLGYYPNPLHADDAVREAALDHLGKVVSAAGAMGVGVVNTFMGGDRTLNVDENWSRAETIFDPLVAHARDAGVTLAFENCPMIFSYDEWPGGHNIAYAPKIFRRIFERWGNAVGMNFDPSHLVWQFIDQRRFMMEFGERFAHVHAKDVMVDRDGLYENGTMSVGMGWQVPRMPGLGEVDWPDFFSALYRVGYDGPVVVEHEDRAFEGTDEKVERGFRLARDVLAPFIH